MKLKLRIGRQRTELSLAPARVTALVTVPAAAVSVADAAAVTVEPAAAAAAVPVPRTQERRVVRAGSFCRAAEVGQTAVTASGRAVVSVPTARCGRWVYADQR
jgi:hypothetical protein